VLIKRYANVNKIHHITAELLSHDATHVNKTLLTIIYVTHHSSVHHPLESCYDSLVDEPQLSIGKAIGSY
jgi:hypothetical protein